MLYFLFMNAFAVPVQLMQQGRLLDNNGTPLEGNQFLHFSIYDDVEAGTLLYEESIFVNVNNGYYAVELGGNSLYPLDSETLLSGNLYLEMDVNNTVLEPRQSLNSVPYARISQIAESVEGGVVNASQISVADQVVVDSTGNWLGQPITPQWSDIQGIPNDFSDGVDNDSDSLADISCPSDDMILYYTGGSWNCGYDDVLDSADVIGFVEGASSLDLDLSSNSTVDGQNIQTGIDQDMLAGINCSAGEILVYNINTSNWDCGTDTDTNLTAQEVKEMVENASVNLAAGSQVNGSDILTTDSTLSVDWSNIANIPSDIDDGDNDNDTLDALNCAEGQVVFQGSGGWECKNVSALFDSDEDGYLAWVDCDDENADLPATDADCDGVITAEDCDDTNENNTALGPIGSNEDCPGTSCKDILDNGTSTGDGTYYINPNGIESFAVTCDMTTNGGGWTIVPETTSYAYQIYSEGNEEQSYAYALSSDQIDAIKSEATEGFQEYACQTVGVGSSYNLRGWDSNTFAVSGSCWATNNSDFKSSSGTYTTLSQIPLLSWFSYDCGDSSEACQHNVDNAYFR